MLSGIKLEEKYQRNGWPSMPRPDIKPPEGWNLSLVTAVNRPRNQRLSPDGQQVAFIWDREDLSDVYCMPAMGGWPRRLTTDRLPVAYWDDEVPRWSPDGRWLAFTIQRRACVAPAVGGIPRQVVGVETESYVSNWMPDNHHLLVLVERDDSVQLMLTDHDGTWPRALVTEQGDVREAEPSPDGRWVAYAFRPSDDPNRRDIRLVEVATGRRRELVSFSKQKDWWPRWSPDGSQVLFLSERSGFAELWMVMPEGRGQRQLTALGCDIADPAWSPDGKRIACTVNHDGMLDLALIDAESGEMEPLRADQGVYTRPQWSPDGTFLTVEFESPARPPDIYRVEVPGGTMTPLTFSMLPALEQNPLVIPERVRFTSDGLEVPALLFRPARPNGAGIVHPHGGPSAQYCFEWDILAQYFIAKGYTLLMPNYRGSTGYGVEYEHANYERWGAGDMQDCLNAARFLGRLDWVVPERIAIYGASYGGYMAACCLSRDPDYLFACGVSKFGDAHLETSWALCNRDLRLYTEMMLGHPAKNHEVYVNGSPIYDVENIESPVLILHGLEDDIVPPESSEAWAEALQEAGKVFEYKTYAGESHGFLKRATQMDAYARIERFMDWYLIPLP